MKDFKKNVKKQGWELMNVSNGCYELNIQSPLGQKHTFYLVGDNPTQLIDSIYSCWNDMKEPKQSELFYEPKRCRMQEVMEDCRQIKDMLYRLYKSLIVHEKKGGM